MEELLFDDSYSKRQKCELEAFSSETKRSGRVYDASIILVLLREISTPISSREEQMQTVRIKNRIERMKRGYFGIGVENLKYRQNLGSLWRSAINLGADFIFVIGKRYHHQSSDTVKAFRHIPMFQYDSIDDLVIPHDCKLIGVEIVEQAKDLVRYQHPERAIYLLGAEDHGLSKEAIEKCFEIIKFDSNFCMNVACAGSIIMWDRKVKSSSE